MKSMKNPLISVILPVYNAENYLAESIKSILNQTFKDFELILINDGSTDGSEDIILSFDDERIVYIKNDINLKLIKSLNKGIRAAKGYYISRMDADDIALPNLFEKQLAVFKRDSNVDIINIRSFLMTENGLTYRRSNSIITVNHDVHAHIVFLQNLISHPGVMLKADILKLHEYCENEKEVPFQDVDLWNRLLNHGHYCYTIDECLLLYRNTPTGVTNTLRTGRLAKRLRYCQNILETEYESYFTENSLKIILGNFDVANISELIRLNKSLSNHITFIQENKGISKNGFSDLVFWKKNLMFVSSFMALKRVPWTNKIGVIIFVMCHLPLWFSNKKWRSYLSGIMFNPIRYR